MKLKFILSFLILPLLLVCCKQNHKEAIMGNLSVSNSTPKPGETITVKYLGEEEPRNPFYYEIVETNSYPLDLKLDEENVGKIKISDSAQVLSFAFPVEGKVDNNEGEGYFLPLFKNGKKIPASDVAAAFFKMADYQLELKNKDSAYVLLKREYLSEKPVLELDMGQMAWWAKTQKDDDFIDQLEAEQKASDTKGATENLYFFYKNIRKDDEKLAQVKEKIETQYPESELMLSDFYSEYNEETDPEKKNEILKKYESHPKKEENKNIYYSAANFALKEGNFDEYEKYVGKLDLPTQASLYNNAAWSFAQKEENLDFAEKISMESLNIIEKLKEKPELKPKHYNSIFSPKQFQENLKWQKGMYADTYAYIQNKKGNLDEAIKYQKIAYGEGDNEEQNQRYIEYLTEAGDKEEILATAPNMIEKGKASKIVIDTYKKAYLEKNPDADVDEKILQLKSKSFDKLKKRIEKGMIDEAAPIFALKNMDGKTVSLADLKGKIVVLDFWATWCGPCIVSFPGMQEVVKANEGNNEVEFLFVDTMESQENREQEVKKFIAENKYDFNVLFDTKNENDGFDVADAYGVEGIPTKIFIGKDGNMKYRSVGFGGTEKTKQEAEILLNLLK